jgi:purine-binding chemotaxis protein CheW
MPASRLLRFPLGREHFGLPLAEALHLADVGPPTPVPFAPGEIAGLADVRGRIVTLVDLARVAGLPPPARRVWRAILLAPPRSHLALLVADEVDILVTDLERATEQGPEISEAGARPVRGVLTEEGLLLNLVDPTALAEACDRRVRKGLLASA